MDQCYLALDYLKKKGYAELDNLASCFENFTISFTEKVVDGLQSPNHVICKINKQIRTILEL